MNLVKQGSGTLVLSNPNIYIGSTQIQGGTVRLQAPTVPPVSGVTFWLDAAQPSTLNGGIGVTNGGGVSAWANIAGLSQAVTQATVSMQPTYVADGIDGHPAILFNQNSSQFLMTPDVQGYTYANGGTADHESLWPARNGMLRRVPTTGRWGFRRSRIILVRAGATPTSTPRIP